MSIRASKCFPDRESLATGVAKAFVHTVAGLQDSGDTVTGDGVVRVVLTGGTVGIATLRQLVMLNHAAEASAEDFPTTAVNWKKVAVFFGDERFLPVGDPQRNDTQAEDALIQHVDIPRAQVFRWGAPEIGEATNGQALDAAAVDYCSVLQREAPDGFDLHLMGMGPEGHVNSLFPNTPELLAPQSPATAVRNCPKPPPQRLSLTLPAVERARRVWLIIAGSEKKEAAGFALRGDTSGKWPAGLVAGREETLLWVDALANPEG